MTRAAAPQFDLTALHPDMEMDTFHPHRFKLPSNVLRAVGRSKVGTILRWRVYRVDGHAVRNRINIDFVSGGNPMRYKFVPRGEVWVEKTVEPGEFAPVVVHELVEAILMFDGQDYDQAHESASATERLVRATTTPARSYAQGLKDASAWVRAWRDG